MEVGDNLKAPKFFDHNLKQGLDLPGICHTRCISERNGVNPHPFQAFEKIYHSLRGDIAFNGATKDR